MAQITIPYSQLLLLLLDIGLDWVVETLQYLFNIELTTCYFFSYYRESCTSRMMREHLRCLVCKYTLKEPVSIPCGHSFCKTCIQSCWTKPAHAGSFPCPQCRKRFKTLPELNLNLTLANVVLTQQQARDSPALLAQTYAGPGDVACDVCSGREIRAVKSCATCRVSYCEAHVKEHYTVGALLKHTLTEPGHDPDTSSEVGLGTLSISLHSCTNSTRTDIRSPESRQRANPSKQGEKMILQKNVFVYVLSSRMSPRIRWAVW